MTATTGTPALTGEDRRTLLAWLTRNTDNLPEGAIRPLLTAWAHPSLTGTSLARAFDDARQTSRDHDDAIDRVLHWSEVCDAEELVNVFDRQQTLEEITGVRAEDALLRLVHGNGDH